MKKIDMSEKAMLKRLDQTEQLRELSLLLIKAKRLNDEKLTENDKKFRDANQPPKPVTR